jgi:hypothetical protein
MAESSSVQYLWHRITENYPDPMLCSRGSVWKFELSSDFLPYTYTYCDPRPCSRIIACTLNHIVLAVTCRDTRHCSPDSVCTHEHIVLAVTYRGLRLCSRGPPCDTGSCTAGIPPPCTCRRTRLSPFSETEKGDGWRHMHVYQHGDFVNKLWIVFPIW